MGNLPGWPEPTEEEIRCLCDTIFINFKVVYITNEQNVSIPEAATVGVL